MRGTLKVKSHAIEGLRSMALDSSGMTLATGSCSTFFLHTTGGWRRAAHDFMVNQVPLDQRSISQGIFRAWKQIQI